MQTEPPSRPLESLSGLIERVTFFNEENGFAVLKVKAKGHRDHVTVIGSLPSVSAGEWLTAEGKWVQDREFGQQFRAEMLNSTAPTTQEGIEKYLGSGMVNPYALAKDIHGIGFKTADQIAQKIGIPIDSLIRACAGLSHVLLEATGEGHCALPMELLKDLAGKLLLVEDKIVTEALERTLGNKDLVQENIAGQELIFLPALKRAEEIIATRIKGLCHSPSAFPLIDYEKALAWCQDKTGKALASSQQEALKLALTRCFHTGERVKFSAEDAEILSGE